FRSDVSNGAEGVPTVPPTVTLNRCTFTGNSATSAWPAGFQNGCFQDGDTPGTFYGGGADLRDQGGGRLRVTNCLFAGNNSTTAGGLSVAMCGEVNGGLFNYLPGIAEIDNVTSVGNSPTGLHLRVGNSGNVTVANSIVRGNTGANQIIT